MNITFTLKCLFLLCSLLHVQGANDLYTVKLKQIKCTDIDSHHILNVTCYVKAERRKYGILYLALEQRNIDKMHVHLQSFYQNSGGHFLPFLINFEYNHCELSKLSKSGTKLFKMINSFRRVYSHTNDAEIERKGCPFNGTFDVTKSDFNAYGAKFLPPMLPRGVFKLVIRAYHKPTNKTFIMSTFKFEIIPKGVKGSMADLSMLNMG